MIAMSILIRDWYHYALDKRVYHNIYLICQNNLYNSTEFVYMTRVMMRPLIQHWINELTSELTPN